MQNEDSDYNYYQPQSDEAPVKGDDDSVPNQDTPEQNADVVAQSADAPVVIQISQESLDTPVELEVIPFYFGFDSAQIQYDENGAMSLQKVAERLQSDETLKVTITGYADTTGSEEYNKQLSLKRAQAVAVELLQLDINAERMKVFGAGEERNSDRSSAFSRRADVVVNDGSRN